MTTMTNEQDLEEIKLITMINLLLNQLSKQLNVAEGSERISFDESNFFQNKDIVNELVTSKLFTANLLDKQKIIDTFTNALDQIQAHIRITSSIRPSPAISKMRDLMNMWEKLLSNPDIAEDISEVVINRYVRSLLTAGRIYSDQYRATSDIAYHLHAMQYEIEAMRAAVYGLPDTKQYRTTRVKTLINCAISAYRIKLYSIAIPLADIAYIYASNKKRGGDIDSAQYRTILRNRAIISYSAGVDKYISSMPDLSDTARVDQYFSIAIEQAEESKNLFENETWNSNICIASCKLQQTKYTVSTQKQTILLNEAIQSLENILQEIALKVNYDEIPYSAQATKLYECERYLAEAYSQKDLIEDSDVKSHQQLLCTALLHAEHAFLHASRFQDWYSLDVQKSYQQYARLKQRFDRMQPDQATQTNANHQLSDLNISEEESKIFDKVYDQENIDASAQFDKQLEQFEQFKSSHNDWTSMNPVKLVNNIVRHEPVTLDDYFGGDDWREKLDLPADFLVK